MQSIANKRGLITKIAALVLSCALWVGCSTTSKTAEQTDNGAIKTMVEQQSFEFIAEWANPLNTNGFNQIATIGLLPPGSMANQINLMGGSNYLRWQGDSVSAYLSYYGERQISGGYNQATAIEFEGLPENYTASYNPKKNRYEIRFDISHQVERYTVNAYLFPNKRFSMNVSSSHRQPIGYRGYAMAIEESGP
ncbi:MAG: DUF4251 domain-containing protein [Bacteroidota bacterium]